MLVPWPKHPFVKHLESRARALRMRVRLDEHARLEPSALVATYDHMVLVHLHTVAGTAHRAELTILERESSAWSAIALREGGGPWLITWNPWHTEARTRVSVLEEVSHIVLEHKPTALVPDPHTGLLRRTYSPSKEREAFGVASAAALPFGGLVHALGQGRTVEEIADQYGVSTQLVTMRINTTRARETLVPMQSRGSPPYLPT